jgi:hypothetical protein
MDNAGQQTAAVPQKRIPPEMWNKIRVLEEVRATFDSTLKGNLRQQLIAIGESHGFSETDLIKRGLITPRPKPNPEGGR